MIRIALPLILVVACMQSHDKTVELRQGDCVTCHLAEFDQTTSPTHRPSGFPQTCADCHMVQAWQPALGLHPEAQFPIKSGVHAVRCLDCHLDITSSAKKGENTTCITDACHGLAKMDPKHAEEDAVDYQQVRGTGSNAHFCLDSRCHPDGRNK